MDLDYLIFLQGLRNDWGVEGLFMLVSSLPKSALTAAIPAILFWCFNKQAGLFILNNENSENCARAKTTLARFFFANRSDSDRPHNGTKNVLS